jgi:integrase
MASFRCRSGKWQVRIQRGAILAQKTFTNKRDAARWALAVEAQMDRGEYAPPTPAAAQNEPQTLNDILTRYDLEISPQHRSQTSRYNVNILKRTLGDTAITKFNAQVVAQWRDEQLKSVKPPTVARQLNTLSAILNHARKEWCYSIANPILDIKRPAQSQSRTRRLAEGEEKKLIEVLEPHYARVVRFALATAMRRGEVLSLKWRNFDEVGRVAVLPLTKNGDARRVPLSSAALTVLKEEAQAPVWSIKGTVFDIHPVAMDKAWRRACRNAGIADLHFHDLRHEAVSRLFELGLNPMEVASISGHKTLSMLQRYTHLKAEDLARKLG